MHPNSFELIKSTSFGGIYLCKNCDIILVSINEGCLIDAEIAHAMIDVLHPIILKYKVELFITDNSAKDISNTPDARILLSDNKSLRLIEAHAIIANDLPTRILNNSFIKFNKPIVPFKLFTSYDKAIQWLYRFKEGNSSKVPSE